MTKIDLVNRSVVDTLKLSQYFARPDALAAIVKPGKKPKQIPDPGQPGAEICTTPGMPQDVRAFPDGKVFFIADMMVDGVHVVDGESFKQVGFTDQCGCSRAVPEPRRKEPVCSQSWQQQRSKAHHAAKAVCL